MERHRTAAATLADGARNPRPDVRRRSSAIRCWRSRSPWGVGRTGTTPPTGPSGLWWGLASGGGRLVFGLVQWWAEPRSGFFTRQRAVGPTKIWHQPAVYPLLGYWL